MSLLSALQRVRGRLRSEFGLRSLHSQWRREARAAGPWFINTIPQRLLVLPSDPGTLIGARGDEAMIQAVVHHLRCTAPELQVAVVTASAEASAAAAAMGFTPLQVWDGSYSLSALLDAAAKFKPDRAVVVGADIMDGYYGPLTPSLQLAIADLLSLHGVRTSVLGFSFNATPHRWLRRAFNRVGPRLALNVRDPISFERFARFTRATAQLVADVAFLLPPDSQAAGVAAVTQWIQQRRASGDLVLGFNLHPMLIKGATAAQVEMLVVATAQAMIRISSLRPVSWLLLAHDYRGALGDDTCLEPLFLRLASSAVSQRVHRVTGARSAAELKALTGLTDGILTGRMHLAIASLGMGVPVLGFSYQDKFEGLFRHFGLSRSLLLSAAQVADVEYLERAITGFIDELDSLRSRVATHLPDVKAASARNLAALGQAPLTADDAVSMPP